MDLLQFFDPVLNAFKYPIACHLEYERLLEHPLAVDATIEFEQKLTVCKVLVHVSNRAKPVLRVFDDLKLKHQQRVSYAHMGQGSSLAHWEIKMVEFCLH